MSVLFTYDGAGTLEATFPAVAGHDYELISDDPGSSWGFDTATGSTLTLTTTGIAGSGGATTYFCGVVDLTDETVLAVATLQIGTTDEFTLLAAATFTYDGSNHASVTFTVPAGRGGESWVLQALDPNFFSQGSQSFTTAAAGSSQTVNLTLASVPAAGTDIILYLWKTGQLDLTARRATVGSTTVDSGEYTWNSGPPPPPPSNDACANAETLVGCAGTLTGDNRGWAGTWPTGADPLFTAAGEGGGAPLWYRWTNPTGRPMLFRVTAQDPGANAVNYNLGITVAADCSSVAFDDSLAGDYLNLAEELGNLQDQFVASNNDPTDGDAFDIVVAPGHTVWIEIDSWTGDTSDPPTADSGHRGVFQFGWEALDYTTRDTTQGAADVLAADASELLVTGLEGGTASQIDPYATLLLDGRVYLLWASHDTHGVSIWGGNCLPDGSDFHSQKIWDNGTSAIPDPTTGDVPRLFTDGTDVFIGFPWYDGGGGPPNPGYTGDCATDPHQPVFLCDECTTGSNLWRYSIYRWDGGAWDPFYSIGDLGAGSESFVPHISDVNHTPYTDFGVRVAASDAMPGKIWIHAAYTVTQLDESLHFNDYPITETPPGALYCTRDRVYIVEYIDTFEIDVASAAATLVARDQHELAEIEHWDHDDPTINPAFGDWQFFDDGPWLTTPDGDFASIIYEQFDLRCDDGFPLLVYSPRLTRDATDATYGNDIVFARPDTAAVLGTWAYDDVALGFESNTTLIVSSLYMGERFTNPHTDALERGVASLWSDPNGVLAPRSWTDRIKSDGSTAPDGVIAGDFTSSGTNKLYPTLFPDPGRDGQWWGMTGPAPGVGSDKNTFHLYELCDHAWSATYSPQFGPDDLGDIAISQRNAYDPVGEYWYFIDASKQLRRAKVLRDYFICEEGSPCVIADIAGLKHNRQRLGVA